MHELLIMFETRNSESGRETVHKWSIFDRRAQTWAVSIQSPDSIKVQIRSAVRQHVLMGEQLTMAGDAGPITISCPRQTFLCWPCNSRVDFNHVLDVRDVDQLV